MQKIQHDSSCSATPLFLIHDAGGTIYGYHTLDDLNRPTYGIANPRLESGLPWTGGVMEMAQCYYAMIKAYRPKGDILLGGWSFGGMLALQMSWIFARDPNVRVRGIVMIDCPFPRKYAPGNKVVMPPMPPGMSQSMQMNLETAVRQTVDMLNSWRLPPWNARHGRPPPAIMLRASGLVPMPERGTVAMVDQLRADRMLGWGTCALDFMEDSFDVPGNHFSIFDPANIGPLSTAIKQACMTLEEFSNGDDDED